jgi:hypothetical protein
MIRRILIAAAAGAAALAAGCAPPAPVPELDLDAPLPDIAAQFVTQVTDEHERRSAEWRFWREPTRLSSESLAERTGERWQLDGRSLFYAKLYHDDRRGVELRADDLGVRDAHAAWAQHALLVNPDILASLEEVEAGWDGDAPFRRYRGNVGGVTWDVKFRVDLLVPLVIERTDRGVRQRTELRELHALAAAPWRATPSDRYDLVDFADLGDRATDPFVIKVQNELGASHVH